MEHIRQHDWCSSRPDIHFLSEDDMDNCVIERIIRNAFHDPMIPKESEDDRNKQKIDWSQVFQKKDEVNAKCKLYVAGLRTTPKFPKLSVMNIAQHRQLLKVICTENPYVLPLDYVPRPNKADQKAYEDLQEIYKKEQQEFIDWAKTLWINNHCIRALRPKPNIETVYEAEFKKRAAEVESFPKNYEMAAHISLGKSTFKCDMKHRQDLISVRMTDLAKVQIPDLSIRRCAVLRPCPTPEPCDKHPCWFVLPNEKNLSVLPLTEIHRELAQYALDHGARCIVSENALKCLVEHDKYWMLPITVCEALNTDGDKENVLVIGSEFSSNRECAMTRTYRAFKHLLEYALIPASEKTSILSKLNDEEPPTIEIQENTNPVENMDVSSDEEEGNLVINEDFNSDIMTDDDSLPADDPPYKSPRSQSPKLQSERNNSPTRLSPIITRRKSPMGTTDELLSKSPLSPKENQTSCTNTIRSPRQSTCDSPEENTNDLSKSLQTSLTVTSPRKDPESSKEHEQEEMDCENSKIKSNCVNGTENGKKKADDFYNCTCRGSVFERPPPRSFRRWEVRNWTTHHNIDIIVHCSHKMKLQGKAEVIAEPIPEYQIELGACKQSEHKIKSLALSLMLRKNASLLNVRIDCEKGDMVRVDNIKKEDFLFRHNTVEAEISNAVYDTVSQLQGLLPGRYILQHEPSHGANALLFVSRSMGSDKKLTLDFNLDVLTESDESKSLKIAPELTPVLLPCHKYRKMLPCAFTPYENQVAKVVPKPPPKTKPPPQALRWPKRKKRGKKK